MTFQTTPERPAPASIAASSSDLSMRAMDFRLAVGRDWIGDRALNPHAANRFDMGQKYADLLTADEVMAALGRSQTLPPIVVDSG